MSTKHRFVARIDSNLWNDLKIKNYGEYIFNQYFN